MGRKLFISIPHASRAKHLFSPRHRSSSLALRLLVLLFLAFSLHEYRQFCIYREQLLIKYSPTSFESIADAKLPTENESPELQERLLNHRHEWLTLGEGWEGRTFAFNSSVIKTFTLGRSPLRNCAPGTIGGRWPTEIPASLALGGLESSIIASSDVNDTVTSSGFLPVKAHFLASATNSSEQEWHLVTPLLPGGNLDNLAKKLRQRHPYKHFREVDSAYRPVFHQVLEALGGLHDKGFCHDDMKASNVFVGNDKNWVLGDLGNLRHVAHPYHSSRLWHQDNGQLLDCRANDVMRTLKAYLVFLRAASNDVEAFDTAFFEGREPLSRLYWRTLSDKETMSATEMVAHSDNENPAKSLRDVADRRYVPFFSSSPFAGRRRALKNAVNAALSTDNSERRARRAAWTFFFGTPVHAC